MIIEYFLYVGLQVKVIEQGPVDRESTRESESKPSTSSTSSSSVLYQVSSVSSPISCPGLMFPLPKPVWAVAVVYCLWGGFSVYHPPLPSSRSESQPAKWKICKYGYKSLLVVQRKNHKIRNMQIIIYHVISRFLDWDLGCVEIHKIAIKKHQHRSIHWHWCFL